MSRVILAGSDQPLRLTPDDLRTALNGYYFDDRQLRRWRIPRGRLPRGSVILWTAAT